MFIVSYQKSNGQSFELYRPDNTPYDLVSAKLELEMGKAGELEIEIPSTNPLRDDCGAYTTEIYVEYIPLGSSTRIEIFRGRPVENSMSLYGVRTIKCEGMLAYLCDGFIAEFKTYGSIDSRADNVISYVLNQYNANVSANRKIYLGNIAWEYPDNYHSILYNGYDRTDYRTYLEWIEDALEEQISAGDGGQYYLVVRYNKNDGKRYLDIHNIKKDASATQPIVFGTNILDVATNIDFTEHFNAVMPLGSTHSIDTMNSEKYNISSYNISSFSYGGKTYSKTGMWLLDTSDINANGFIPIKLDLPDTVSTDGTAMGDTHANLRDCQISLVRKAAQELYKNSEYVLRNIDISAVDLSGIDRTMGILLAGQIVRVNSPSHGINNEYLHLRVSNIDLLNPANSSYQFGNDSIKMSSAASSSTRSSSKSIAASAVAQSRNEYIAANYVATNNLDAETARITKLTTSELRAAIAEISNLIATTIVADYATLENLQATNATISNLQAKNIDVDNLAAKTAELGYIKSEQIDSVVGNFGYIKAVSIAAGTVVADKIESLVGTFGYLNADMANLDTANINKANIAVLFNEVGLISDATIVDGHVTGNLASVSIDAGLIKTGTLDASNITVSNLNADSIITGTLNGQLIGKGSVDLDKLSQTVATNIQNAIDDSADAILKATQVGNELQALEVGSRNLLLRTNKPTGELPSRIDLLGSEFVTALPIGGLGSKNIFGIAEHGVRVEVGAGVYVSYYMNGASTAKYGLACLEPGRTYTISFDWTCKLYSGTVPDGFATDARLIVYTSNGNFTKKLYDITPSNKGVEQSGRLEYTFTIPDGSEYVYFRIYGALAGNGMFLPTDFIELRNMKLEKGTKATDWTPAPEDIDGAIGNIVNVLDRWSYDADYIWIDGGNLYANTVVADAIAANAIVSDKIAANAVTAGKIAASAITADKIAANAITSDKVLAGSITADKLSVGGMVNLADATVEDTGHAYTGVFNSGGWKVVDGYITKSANTTGNLYCSKEKENVFKNGDTIFYRIVGHADTAGTVRVMITFGDVKGVTTGNSSNYSNIDLTTEDIEFTGTVKCANATQENKRYFAVGINDNRTTKSQIYIKSVEFYKQNGTTLIQDGAITTDKILANAITSSKIDAGAITTDKLAANAVTAAKIDVNDLFSQNITATNFNLTGGSINIKTSETEHTDNIIYLENRDKYTDPTGETVYGTKRIASLSAFELHMQDEYSDVTTEYTNGRIQFSSFAGNDVSAYGHLNYTYEGDMTLYATGGMYIACYNKNLTLDKDAKAWTGNAGFTITSSSEQSAFTHIHSVSGYKLNFGVGAGGYNRGIYDSTPGVNKWMMYADGDDFVHFNNPVVFEKVVDASGTGDIAAYSGSVFIGPPTGAHMAFDNNEIMAKASGNTVNALYLNNDGGLVTVGSGGLNVVGSFTASNIGQKYAGTNAKNVAAKTFTNLFSVTLTPGTYIVLIRLYCTKSDGTSPHRMGGVLINATTVNSFQHEIADDNTRFNCQMQGVLTPSANTTYNCFCYHEYTAATSIGWWYRFIRVV